MSRYASLSEQLRHLLAAEGVPWSEDLGPHLDALVGAVHDSLGAFEDTEGDHTAVGPETWYADAPTQRVTLEEETQDVDCLAGRYEVLGALGRGGMGTVHRARDIQLNRIVALKKLHANATPAARSRFLQEAQATSQLEHPGIVPIYDAGLLQDGTPYYTMQIIRGRTLSALLKEVHQASSAGRWEPGFSGASMHTLLQACLKMADAMAYAHDRGVTHRDLKPQNVMLGRYGQTLVVDWGLAKVRGQASDEDQAHEAALITSRTSSDNHTIFGVVAGTPHYMPPEQARGELASMGPTADVWSLGAILYEVLTGRPPFLSGNRMELLAQVIAGDVPDPHSHTSLPLPPELTELVMWCLSKRPEDRPQTAQVVAREIGAWLAGERNREQALQLAEEAGDLEREVTRLRASARSAEAKATHLLEALSPWRPVQEKQPGWTLQHQAAEQRTQADHLDVDRLQRLRQAHQLAPDLAEVNDPLAAHYLQRHRIAEAAGDLRAAHELERHLRVHADERLSAYLDGIGHLSLVTEVPAEVQAQRYTEHDRRLVLSEPHTLGITPLNGVQLGRGSYLLTLRAKGRAPVSYPIFLGRDDAWRGGPDPTDPRPLHLPALGAIPAGQAYVPAGWFTEGGDPACHVPRPAHKLWLDGFVMQTLAVSVGDYLQWLEHLIHTGDRARFEAMSPPAEALPLVEHNGGLEPGPDAEGFIWTRDHPIHSVDLSMARAYAAWRASQDALPWRLPTSPEWEKAARGVDGRFFPFGNHLDPTWARVMRSSPDPAPMPGGSYPLDCSVYGIRDLAGSLSCWTETLFDPHQDLHIIRGGSWAFGSKSARSAEHMRMTPSARRPFVGIRLVRSISEQDG